MSHTLNSILRQAAKFGLPIIECPDGFGSCAGGGQYGGNPRVGDWYFDVGGQSYYFGGYQGGNNSIGSGSGAQCNCLHGTAYIENGACKCCDGVLVGGNCTGGIKSPSPPPLLKDTARLCTMDAKICPDGSTVERDPYNGCQFKPCQTTGAAPSVNSVVDLIKANPIPSAVIAGVVAFAFLGSGNTGSKK